MKKFVCESCGKKFDSHYALNGHKTTHSKKHTKAMNNKGDRSVVKTCEKCGDKFEVTKSRENTARFCSRKCKEKWESENLKGKNSHRWKDKGNVKCDYCGKEFHKRAAEVNKHNFCSQKCFNKWKSENSDNAIKNLPDSVEMKGEKNPRWKGGKVTKICLECGNKFEIKPAKKSNSTFCSRECKANWQKRNLTGENNPHWRGGYEPYYGANWREQKRKALKRDNHTCQRCGKNQRELGKEPDVHHKRPIREFKNGKSGINYKKANKLSNLISLCPKCHKKIEKDSAQVVYAK